MIVSKINVASGALTQDEYEREKRVIIKLSPTRAGPDVAG